MAVLALGLPQGRPAEHAAHESVALMGAIEQGGSMFLQVIEGKVRDPDLLMEQMKLHKD